MNAKKASWLVGQSCSEAASKKFFFDKREAHCMYLCIK